MHVAPHIFSMARTDQSRGVPQGYAPKWPGGPPNFDRSGFFCLLCLNNYSKIFHKRRISKLLPGAPGVLEVWKKLQKFPTNILKNYTHQNTPNYNTNTHFGVLGLHWGAWGGQHLQGGGGVGHFPPPKNFLKKIPCFVLVIRTY